jgi:hypothetical protein
VGSRDRWDREIGGVERSVGSRDRWGREIGGVERSVGSRDRWGRGIGGVERSVGSRDRWDRESGKSLYTVSAYCLGCISFQLTSAAEEAKDSNSPWIYFVARTVAASVLLLFWAEVKVKSTSSRYLTSGAAGVVVTHLGSISWLAVSVLLPFWPRSRSRSSR